MDCTYTFLEIEGDPPLEITITSSAELLSQHGILGVFVDPLVLQVPDGASNFMGTVEDGSGPQAVIATEAGSFFAESGVEIFPEAGQKFLILELPPALLASLTSAGMLAGPFDFDFEFEVPQLSPVDVKAMFTGKIEVNGQTFYPPLLPCVTDFSTISPISIPVSTGAVNLLPQAINAASPSCNGQIYNFPAPAGAPLEIPALGSYGLLVLFFLLVMAGVWRVYMTS